MELKNKRVLITGSGGGIGKEIALAFSRQNCNIIITYKKNIEEAKSVFNECNKKEKSLLVNLDVTNQKSIDSCVSKIIDEFKNLDVLVNNAGVISWKNLKEQTNEEIENQINVNLMGMIKMTKAVLPYMEQGGVIINISSGAGKKAHKDLTTYCATKFGVIGFTRSLAMELPSNIKTYSVNPGRTATGMTDYIGNPPKKIAELIVRTVQEQIKVDSGEDVDIWRFL